MSQKLRTITKRELAQSISQLGLSYRYSKKIVDRLCAWLAEGLRQGEVIHLVGFGSFQYKIRPARRGRNPRTGEAVEVPQKKNIYFRAGTVLKKMVRKSSRTSD